MRTARLGPFEFRKLIAEPGCLPLGVLAGFQFGVLHSSVSYTHLDVYKRQEDNTPASVDLARAAKIFLMPDREELFRRIDARFDAMIAAGALDEVSVLATRNLDPNLPAMKAHGVPWLIRHLRREIALAEAVEHAKLETRQYTKRQATWFRNQLPEFEWAEMCIRDRTRQALVVRLGNPVRVITEPGLNMKVPFIDSVIYIDKRILTIEQPAQEVIASSGDNTNTGAGQAGERLVVDAFARYRITDPLKFYQTVGPDGASSQLAILLNSTLRSVLGEATLTDVVRNRREELMGRMRDQLDHDAQPFGIHVVLSLIHI